MEFKRENPECTFTIPDRPTVRQQLEYFSRTAGFGGEELLFRYWRGAIALIQTWKCDALEVKTVKQKGAPPILEFPDLDTISNPSQRDVIIWAGLQVQGFMNQLEDIPKNS